MQDESISRARDVIAQHELKYRRLARRWIVGYRALLVSSALCSASAAVVGKLDHYKFEGASDIAAILAALAAVITTLIAALNFEVNWRINRRSRHDVTVIGLESHKSTANADTLIAELQRVVKLRNEDFNKQD